MNRLSAMRYIAWLLAAVGVVFGLFTIVFGIVGPDQEIHAVHNAVVASLLLVLTAPPMIAVARDPGRAIRPLVILAALTVAGLAAMAVALTPDPFILPVLVLIGVLWWLAPSREGAVPPGRMSLVMLGLVIAGALLLLPFAVEQAGLQRTDRTSDHAAFYHWVEMAFTATGIVLVGLVASVRPAAFRMATWTAGLALAILGAASLLFAQHASALTAPSSWAALIGGLVFIAVGEWEARRTSRNGAPRPIADAEATLHRMLRDRGIDPAKPPSMRSVWSVFSEFVSIPFGTPDDGVLYQAGTFGFHGADEFYIDFLRQFEVVYSDGEHHHYEQLHCEFRFPLSDQTRTFDGYERWWFAGTEPWDDFVRVVEERPEFVALSTTDVFNVSISQEAV
jgi:hypothetical protein